MRDETTHEWATRVFTVARAKNGRVREADPFASLRMKTRKAKAKATATADP